MFNNEYFEAIQERAVIESDAMAEVANWEDYEADITATPYFNLSDGLKHFQSAPVELDDIANCVTLLKLLLEKRHESLYNLIDKLDTEMEALDENPANDERYNSLLDEHGRASREQETLSRYIDGRDNCLSLCGLCKYSNKPLCNLC